LPSTDDNSYIEFSIFTGLVATLVVVTLGTFSLCVCVCFKMDSRHNADESYLGIRLAYLEHVDDVPGLGTIPSVGIHRKKGIISQLSHWSLSSYNTRLEGIYTKTHQIQLIYRTLLMTARVLWTHMLR